MVLDVIEHVVQTVSRSDLQIALGHVAKLAVGSVAFMVERHVDLDERNQAFPV